MRYALFICGDESDRSTQDNDELTARYTKWTEEFAPILRGGERLRPTETATTVQLRDGTLLTTDGPFAETKEQIGGYFVVECDDLDKAIDAASKLPAAENGSIEVRPIWDM